MCPLWHVPQVTGIPEPSIFAMWVSLISSVISYMLRARTFNGLESSAKLRFELSSATRVSVASAWQASQRTPSERDHSSIMLLTCRPVRPLGRALRFLGARNVRDSDGGLPVDAFPPSGA